MTVGVVVGVGDGAVVVGLCDAVTVEVCDGVGDGVSGVLDARYISHLVALKLRNRKFVLVSLPI